MSRLISFRVGRCVSSLSTSCKRRSCGAEPRYVREYWCRGTNWEGGKQEGSRTNCWVSWRSPAVPTTKSTWIAKSGCGAGWSVVAKLRHASLRRWPCFDVGGPRGEAGTSAVDASRAKQINDTLQSPGPKKLSKECDTLAPSLGTRSLTLTRLIILPLNY